MKSSCNMSKVIWFFRLLVVVLVLSTLTAPLPADAQGSVVSLSGVGTATIDGQLAPGEWDLAGKVNFLVNLPLADGGGTTPGALFVSQSAEMAASSTSFCGAPVPKLCIAEPGQTGLGLNRSYALLISQNALPGGEKKPQLIYFIPFILILALWAVLFLVFRKRKRKK